MTNRKKTRLRHWKSYRVNKAYVIETGREKGKRTKGFTL